MKAVRALERIILCKTVASCEVQGRNSCVWDTEEDCDVVCSRLCCNKAKKKRSNLSSDLVFQSLGKEVDPWMAIT